MGVALRLSRLSQSALEIRGIVAVRITEAVPNVRFGVPKRMLQFLNDRQSKDKLSRRRLAYQNQAVLDFCGIYVAAKSSK